MADPLVNPPAVSPIEYPDSFQNAADTVDYSAPPVGDFIDTRSGAADNIFPLFDSTEGTGRFGSMLNTRAQSTLQTQQSYNQQADWRVRLSLAPGATYLYNAASEGDILAPLQATNGVIFPYTPQISVSYRASYDPAEITHSNYRLFFYKNSAVDDIQIVADFTAQDTGEASYVLAVIHFFKSVTKMFYGQDTSPTAGTPPPLCFLSGLGQYQFNNHPLLITNFQYALPNDVDYIRAGSTSQYSGQNLSSYQAKGSKLGFLDSILGRLAGSGLRRGAISAAPKFSSLSNSEATYIPTKIQLIISCVPVVSRNDISKNFSVTDYATGALTKKGIW